MAVKKGSPTTPQRHQASPEPVATTNRASESERARQTTKNDIMPQGQAIDCLRVNGYDRPAKFPEGIENKPGMMEPRTTCQTRVPSGLARAGAVQEMMTANSRTSRMQNPLGKAESSTDSGTEQTKTDDSKRTTGRQAMADNEGPLHHSDPATDSRTEHTKYGKNGDTNDAGGKKNRRLTVSAKD